MKRFHTAVAAAGFAASLLAAPLAMAQSAQNHPGDDHAHESHMAGPAEASHMTPPRPAVQHQMAEQHGPMQPAHGPMPMAGHEPSHGPMADQGGMHQQEHVSQGGGQHWHHGDHFNGERRVVNNWSYYHAAPPPPGYEWVQDGSELLLIGVASGIIADVLLNAQ